MRNLIMKLMHCRSRVLNASRQTNRCMCIVSINPENISGGGATQAQLKNYISVERGNLTS